MTIECITQMLYIDMHRIPPTHPPSPRVLRSHTYALAKLLTAVLQYINIYTCNQVLEENSQTRVEYIC